MPRGLTWLLVALASAPLRVSAESGCGAQALTLAALEQRVRDNNPDLRLVRSAIEAAHADLVTAGERPNPTLSLSSRGYDLQGGVSQGGGAWEWQADTVLEIEQPIERGGKRALRRDVALRALAAANADYEDQLRQTMLALRKGFYDARLAGQKLEISRELSVLQADTLGAAGRRVAAGDLARTDLARLQVEALRAENELRQAEADDRASGLALGYLIGCAGTRVESAGEWPAVIEPGPMDARETQRADVVAAQFRQQQSRSALALARAAQVRDVSVSLQYEHYPNGVPAPERGDNLLGLGVSVPLFLAHSHEGELARAEADVLVSSEQLARVNALAAVELARAHGDLVAAASRAHSYREKILPAAQSTADAIEYAYTRRAVALLDLLDARRTLRATRIEAATAQSDYAKAEASWAAATTLYVPGDLP